MESVLTISAASMNRMVKKDIILSDGTKLPAGARIMVSNDKTGDATIYPDPTRFDAARFQNLRQQPGEENRHQFVTTTATHMGFGHGQHACPGRFFASNEMKILLCFLLVNYDFRHIPDQARPSYLEFETSRSAKPTTAVQVRRRQAEIDLADLQQE